MSRSSPSSSTPSLPKSKRLFSSRLPPPCTRAETLALASLKLLNVAEVDGQCRYTFSGFRLSVFQWFPIVKRKDEAAHGEYRTKRVILEIYDAMQQAIETGQPYQTLLDPPPADPRVAHPPRNESDVLGRMEGWERSRRCVCTNCLNY